MSVVLEHHSGFKLCRESQVVANALKRQGRAYTTAALSQLQRDRIMTDTACLVVGSLDFIKAALRQRKLTMPAENCYPEALRPFLHRQLWESTLHEVIQEVVKGKHLFAKPSRRTKRFTGMVIKDGFDYRLSRIPGREPVWCGEVCDWQSEWRYYVVCHQIQGKGFYSGDASVAVDEQVVRDAVALLASHPGTPVSYAIDFGVLSCGQTALVEMNEGFSIGAYDGVDEEVYLALLETRWAQLTAV
jgi:hypothetical protein